MLHRKVFMDGERPTLYSFNPDWGGKKLGHYTCSAFDLELFIPSSVLMSLTRSCPSWVFFPTLPRTQL